MKKLISITAAAVMLLAGCSRNEILVPISQDKDDLITFSTYVGRSPQTRGKSMDLNNLKEKSFGVYAFYEPDKSWDEYETTEKEEPGFMDNVNVYWSGDKNAVESENLSTDWKYDNLKYWPEDGDDVLTRIHFFAYAPYKEGTEWTGETGKIPFKLEEDITKLEDFVYSATSAKYWKDMAQEMRGADDDSGIAVIEKPDGSMERRVPIRFRHALSRIGFSATVDAPDHVVTITEITVGGTEALTLQQAAQSMLAQGTLSLDQASGNEKPEVRYLGFYKSGYFKLAGVYEEDAVAQQEGDPETVVTEPVNYWDVEGSEAAAIFTLDEDNLTPDPISGENPMKVNKDDSYLFVIPQKFEYPLMVLSVKEENKITSFALPINVKYKVKKKDAADDTAVTYESSSSIEHNFHQGKAYTILIDLTGAVGLQAIKFAVVDDFDWYEEQDVDVTLDNYVTN